MSVMRSGPIIILYFGAIQGIIMELIAGNHHGANSRESSWS